VIGRRDIWLSLNLQFTKESGYSVSGNRNTLIQSHR
jgi:hypothetical protein